MATTREDRERALVSIVAIAAGALTLGALTHCGWARATFSDPKGAMTNEAAGCPGEARQGSCWPYGASLKRPDAG